jgi:hypothetical protein
MRRVNEGKVEIKQVPETQEEGNGVHEILFRGKLQKMRGRTTRLWHHTEEDPAYADESGQTRSWR